MISRFFEKTLVVRRLKNTGTDERRLSATATVDGNIQTINEIYGSDVAGSLSRTFKIYTDVEDDIKDNDQIQDKDTGKVYLVKSVVKKDYAPLEHLEITADEVVDV